MKRRIVVLSGAGISADSGLKTFRDSDGLWEGHRVDQVATPEAFARNPQQVIDCYNAVRVASTRLDAVISKPSITYTAKDFLASTASINCI